jgi:hypothetical protein
MRFAALLLPGLVLLGCSSMGDRYVRDTSASCGTGDRLACETLATMHPQALLDADAIMEGMQQARMRRELFQRATP